MIRLIAYALAAVIAALATATISERLLTFDTPQSVIIFGLVMGVIGAFIKPIVRLLSFPITCLTFGLFSLVINAALFGLGSFLVPGIEVSWVGAVLGSLLVSIASGVIFSVLDE
jgi:putative membrane protein